MPSPPQDDRESFYDQLLSVSIIPVSEGLSKLLTEDFFRDPAQLNWILEKALVNRDRQIVEFLLSSGLGIHRLNDVHQTAVHLAARCGYLDIVDSLFEYCRANLRDDEGLTHFHVACMAGNVAMVKHFLWNRVDVDAIEAKDSYTPLHCAVLHRRLEVVELLLKHGAKVDALDRGGRSPLHLICWDHSSLLPREEFDVRTCRQDVEFRILEHLVGFGSNLNLRDQLGNTALMYTFRDDYCERLSSRLYCSWLEKRRYLNEYENMRKRKVELLLRNGTDVQLVNNDDETALHIAIAGIGRSRSTSELQWMVDTGSGEVMELLLSYGARVNVKNKRNETPLQIAVSVMSLETVKLLLSHKADVENLRFEEGCFQHSTNGGLPCLEAVENLVEIVQVLRDKGFQISRRSNVAVLKFFIPNNEQFYWDDENLEGTTYKLKNLLEYGTSSSIQTALNNFPTNIDETSLSEQCLRHRVIQQIQLYLTSLKIGNLYLDDVTRLYLERKISHLRRCILGFLLTTDTPSQLADLTRLRNEVQLMRTTMLTRQLSLHDALRKNPVSSRSRELSSVLRSDDFANRFFRCASVVKAHCAKSLVRHYVRRSAEECLPSLTRTRLPQLCCERICGYLDNECLVDVCSAAAIDESRNTREA